MCGLVGVAGTIGYKDVDVFNELLVCDYVRGMDSTGVAGIAQNDDVSLVKMATDPIYLQAHKKYGDAVRTSHKAIIGHNRKATLGKVNHANAHPFSFTNITGAHNGTLDSWSRSDLPGWKDYDTDSEALYHCIETKGINEAIKSQAGAWALSYFNAETNSMCFLRNAERPLCFALSESKKTLYWASEPGMLRWITSRNGIKLDKDTIWCFPENNHWAFEIPKSGAEFGDAVVTKIEGKKPRPQPSYAQLGYHGGGGNVTRGPWRGDGRTVEPTDLLFEGLRIKPPYSFGLSKNHVNSKKHFNAYTQNMCDCCGGDINFGDQVLFYPLWNPNNIQVACVDCLNNDAWNIDVKRIRKEIEGKRKATG